MSVRKLGVAALAFAAVTFVTVLIAHPRMFGGFMGYDDEGYMLVALKGFVNHGELYDRVFTQYGPVARQVIEALIDKYADEGVQTIESMDVLNVPPLTDLGSPVELVRSFGGRDHYLQALQLLERELYAPQGLQP